MAVTVLVPTALRGEAAGQARLSVESAGSLGAVLGELRERWPLLERRLRDERGRLRRYVNLYIDGVDCRDLGGPDAAVPDGAEVQILPSIAGG